MKLCFQIDLVQKVNDNKESRHDLEIMKNKKVKIVIKKKNFKF